MRWVITRVFPEPAPARINSGPSTHWVASAWAGFKPSSRTSTEAGSTEPEKTSDEAGVWGPTSQIEGSAISRFSWVALSS